MVKKNNLTTQEIRGMFKLDYINRKDIVSMELDRLNLVQAEFGCYTDDDMMKMPCSRFDIKHKWVIDKINAQNGEQNDGFKSIRGQ